MLVIKLLTVATDFLRKENTMEINGDCQHSSKYLFVFFVLFNRNSS